MINIRPANPEEIHIIVDFQIAMASETENLSLDIQTVTQGVKAVFENPEKGKYYVAEENGTVTASMLTTFEWSDWRNKTVSWIQSVYVRPEHRKKGLFKLMYKHIKDKIAKKTEFSGIRLYVDKTNINAQKVYEKVGMNGNHYQLFEDFES